MSSLLAGLGLVGVSPSQAPAQPVGAGELPRAIRREVPITDAIARAFAAGTRDRTGRPGANYWQLEADYAIDVRVDESTGELHGRQTVTVRNGSPEALDRLVFRLDHNLFRADAARDGSTPAETTDGMVVLACSVGGTAVPRTSGWTGTVAQFRLPKPIAAGGQGEVELQWRTRLPGGDGGRGHRMTQRWDLRVFQPTQWYPRLAKFDDLRGWNLDPYLGPSEFYNNFGRFDVRIDVPAGWLVSGTGVLQNADAVLAPAVRERLAAVLASGEEGFVVTAEQRGAGLATAPGDRLVWRYLAERVNDFAWATSAEYVWRAQAVAIPGRGPVPVHQFFLPERARLFARAGAAASHALRFYSGLLVPYPFPQLTFQDGPSDGMEYPMVVNSNQGAADHEIAHQWWPMLVGNNETRHGWMDEGLNMYTNILSDAARRGRVANLDGRGQLYGRVWGDEDEPPMVWNANQAGRQYGFVTYEKAPMMLSMLGGLVGDERVQAALRAFAQTWAYKHPSPWDFAFFVERELGVELGWFWNGWLWQCQSVDGRLLAVREVGSGGEAGVDVVVRQDGDMPAPIVLRVAFDPAGPAAVLPAGAVRREDGTVDVVTPVAVWFDGRREHTVPLRFGGAVVTAVTLDPAGRFPDRERADNVWSR